MDDGREHLRQLGDVAGRTAVAAGQLLVMGACASWWATRRFQRLVIN